MTEITTASGTAVVAAAARARAAETGVPRAPVRDLIRRDDAATAYAVQQFLTARRIESGARVIGRKIGLTSVAVHVVTATLTGLGTVSVTFSEGAAS